MTPIRIAVAGFGLIGREHVRRILVEPQARLAAIVEPEPVARQAAAGPAAPVLASLEELIARRLADAVILATPTALHADQAVACLEAGLPVLVEKPLAHSLEAAWRIVAVQERAGLPVLVGHHRRHSTWIHAAKTIVEQGGLGAIRLVDALTWFAKPPDYFAPSWRRQRGAGPVLTNLIHVIDDLRNLVGEIVQVQALCSNALRGFEVEDTAVALLRFAGGALGTVSVSDGVAAPWSWEHGSGENPWFPRAGEACYRLGGTRASLALPGLELWRHEADGGWMKPFERLSRTIAETDPLAIQLRHFCGVVAGHEGPILDARGGLVTLAATLAILEAATQGGAIALESFIQGPTKL